MKPETDSQGQQPTSTEQDDAQQATRAKQWWSPSGLIQSTTTRAAGILTRSEKILVRRRMGLIAIAVVALAALVASLGNYIFLAHSPREAADNYLSRLQSGNYFMAVDASAYSNQSAVFLKNSMYRAAQGRVQEYSITSVDQQGDRAVAQAELTIEGQKERVEIPLVQDHRSGVFNDVWRLDYTSQVNQKISSTIDLDSVELNGYQLKMRNTVTDGEHAFHWDMPLLPGEYILDFPKDSYYAMAGGAKTISLGFRQTELAPVDIRVRPSARMWQETDAAIEAWVQTCESAHTLAPSGCPASQVYDSSGRPLDDSSAEATPSASVSSSPSAARPRKIEDVKWELQDRPPLVLTQNENQPSLWEANQNDPAVFRLTYTVDGKPQSETVEAYIHANITSTGDTASISAGLDDRD